MYKSREEVKYLPIVSMEMYYKVHHVGYATVRKTWDMYSVLKHGL